MFVLVKVTAAFLARTLPVIVAPESSVMDVKASKFPLKDVLAPNVAELVICQNIFLACAPFLRMTLPPTPPTVVNADPTWNIQTAVESPCASRVKSPDSIKREDVDL